MIVIAADHGGFHLKEALKMHLDKRGIPYLDVGTDSPESCDYPVFAERACREIEAGTCEYAILVCGTGIGMALSANKCKGIRASACSDTYSARMMRAHNNANALCLGARVIGEGLACDIVDTFLATEFEGGRHARRVGMIMDLEAGKTLGD